MAAFRPLSDPPCSVPGGVVEADEKHDGSSASCQSVFSRLGLGVMGTYQAAVVQAAGALLSQRLARTFRAALVVDYEPMLRYDAAKSRAGSRIVHKNAISAI